MSNKPSWRALIDAKIIKRTDSGMSVLPGAIRIVPGFNLRDENADDYRADIDALKGHLARGGQVPALEVTLSPDGQGVDVVDGHRRTTAYLELIAEGHLVPWIRIEEFKGNDVERAARVLTSNEGRKLRPLEVAEGYRRLTAFGLTPDDIARRVIKTRQHVDQMLLLANAPHAVHEAVRAGEISATEGTKLARQGEMQARAQLEQAREQAKAQGKKKITAGVTKAWTPPAKIVAPVIDSAGKLLASMKPQDRAMLTNETIVSDEGMMLSVDAGWLRQLLLDMDAITQAKEQADIKARQKAEKAAQMEIAGVEGA